ncbi:ribosomal protein S10 [Coprinopsis marcescibilis]|uniref:Small ribosomal subunit protein uS10m n=1 Tax=Coprinopsis marcescibilis TaxID=230819 RepID=A0A5C3KX96_COPMA|nr:ribosomal protein S10 [Coprinopsis marcescibilis]
MLRAAICRPTRSWLPTVTARLVRYNSTGVSQPESSKSGKASAPSQAPAKPIVKAAAVESTAGEEEEKQMEEALMRAIQQIQKEEALQEAAPSAQKIEGYEGPIFNAALPPDAKYNPADLPIKQSFNPRYDSITEEEWSATLVHGRSVQDPIYHKPVYNIPAVSIQFRSYHPKLLDFFCHFASHAAASLGIPISKTVHLPTQRSMWTVPRSPFAHKKSQENFERKTHKRAIKAWDTHPLVVERWCQYLRKHALAGVGMKVTRWNRLPLGYGATNASVVNELTHKATKVPTEHVKKLADKIIQKELPSSGDVKPPAQPTA